MQHATTPQPTAESAAGSGHGPPPDLNNQFVINLCGSTTPVALTPPDHAGLKRFTFFVSRRREEGRERFRLHMGYFDSQEAAEKLLDIVREIYPGAWAGLAPGQRLRARAQAAAVAATQAHAPVQTETSAAPAPVAATPAAAVAAETVASPPPVAPSIAVAAPALAEPAATAARPELSLVPDQGRRRAAPATGRDSEGATRALSDVRAAIASLDDASTGAPTLSPLPELKPARRAQGQRAAEAATPELSGVAALGILEGRSEPVLPAAGAGAKSTADSTVRQPRLGAGAASASSLARPLAEKATFAVQLLWSVQPIDIAQIPQLAIFSAYTLYGAEGHRDGRRWYGVRLGFFTDAVSAKQVAHYVRSDFSTVSVVPVTARERERARLAAGRPDATPVSAAAPVPAAAVAGPPAAAQTGFDFIEDVAAAPAAQPVAAAGPAPRPARGAPGKRAKLRAGRQVQGRARSRPMTLEETLEILGASELQMDDGRRSSDGGRGPGAGRSTPARDKPSRFGRLLERLSERLGS